MLLAWCLVGLLLIKYRLMKYLMLLCVGVVIIGSAFYLPGSDQNETARAPKIEGKYIFMLCEPAQEYETVQGDFDFLVWSIKTPGDFVYPAIKKANKKGWQYDGLKVDINGKVELIKFTE